MPIPPIDPAISGNALVPSVRCIMDTEIQNESNNGLEYESLSAGTIADLCNVTRDWKYEQHQIRIHTSKLRRQQQQQQNDKEDYHEEEQEYEDEDIPFVATPYEEPLRPHDIPVGMKLPHVEPGRLDIRIMKLYEELKKS